MTLLQEIREIPSRRSDLRSFGLALGAIFLLIAGISFWRGHAHHAQIWSCVGGPLILLGVVWPDILKPLQKAWMVLGLLMGWVMSRVILIVLFYTVVFPVGLLMRLAGKDPLERRQGPPKNSYWKMRPAQSRKDFENPF